MEIDIEKFFNSMIHDRLLEVLQQKVSDAFFLRHVRRLLRGSILHTDGTLAETLTGTPQGSPVSPVLANICLNHVLDQWFQQNYTGRGEMVRYADDAVFVFTDEAVALEFLQTLRARMNEFGLNLNEDKCAVVPFSSSEPKGTFAFLGLEYYWGKNIRKQKCLKVKTAPKRLHRCMAVFEQWIKSSRNRMKLDKLWELATAKLIGHYRYFGVSFNQPKLAHFYWQSVQALFKWLNRRSQKRSFTWERFKKRLQYQPLPRPLAGFELTDITNNSGSAWNRKPKSRMRENRKLGYGELPITVQGDFHHPALPLIRLAVMWAKSGR